MSTLSPSEQFSAFQGAPATSPGSSGAQESTPVQGTTGWTTENSSMGTSTGTPGGGGSLSELMLQKEMQSSFLHVPQTIGSYEFHIRDFGLLPHQKNQKYISSPFSISGTDKWEMAILPGGDANDTSVIVYLRNLNTDECRASCSLFLTGDDGLKFVGSTDVAQAFAPKGTSGDSWATPLPFAFTDAQKSNFEFVKNGDMIVVAKMTICGNPEFLSQADTSYEHPITTLQSDMEFLLCQASGAHGAMRCDITLVSGEVKVPCHQSILACRSKVFRDSFLTSTTTVKLMLHGGKNIVNKVHPSVLREFVHFIYTDQCRPEFLIGDQLVYMFSAACKYQVLGLMAICEKQMEHNLNVANAAHYLAAADQIGARSLKMACLRFIAAHSSDVVASEGYRDLDSRLCRMILGEVSMSTASTEDERNQQMNPANIFSADEEDRRPPQPSSIFSQYEEDSQGVLLSSSEDIADVGSVSRESKISSDEPGLGDGV